MRIVDNTFADISVNALTLHGIEGSGYGQNVVEGNRFTHSHHTGRYEGAAGIAGNIYGGGMVYLMAGQYITFQRNTFEHGYCANCQLDNPDSYYHHEVRGLELDGNRVDEFGYQQVVSDIRVLDNSFVNLTADALFHNYGWEYTGPLTRVEVRGNRFWLDGRAVPPEGSPGALRGSSIVVSDNDIADAIDTRSWESPNEWNAETWNSWGLCEQWSVARYCAGHSLDGRCSLRLSSGPGCHQVCTQSPPKPIRQGQYALLGSWVRNGGFDGISAVVFLDANYEEIGQRMQSLERDEWQFRGEPIVRAQAPAGAAFVSYKFCVFDPNATVDHDMTRMSP